VAPSYLLKQKHCGHVARKGRQQMNIKFAFDIFVRGAGGESRKNWNEGKY
jgi:hypothetical protein